MKKIIIAIDSFKGCLTSREANQAAAEGVLGMLPDAEVIQLPVSDGGEGWLEAFRAVAGGTLTPRPAALRCSHQRSETPWWPPATVQDSS